MANPIKIEIIELSESMMDTLSVSEIIGFEFSNFTAGRAILNFEPNPNYIEASLIISKNIKLLTYEQARRAKLN